MFTTFTTRRAWLLALSAVPLLGAAKRKALVVADLGTAALSSDLAAAVHDAGYDGFIQDAPAGRGPKALAVRAALPRFEDSMDEAASGLRKIAEAAAQQGAEALIVTHPGLSGNGAFRGIDLERKARTLDLAGAICAARGMQLFYQNQSLEFTGNGAEERALIARTDPQKVSYLLDVAGATASGIDAAAFFEPYAKRIGGIRLAEANDPLAAAVKRAKWSGWLIATGGSVETFKPVRERIRAAFGV